MTSEQPTDPNEQLAPRVVSGDELGHMVAGLFHSREWWSFVWWDPTKHHAADLERRFAGKDHSMDVCKTVILVGLPGHPCITFLRKSRLSVARLRGWMLERGITLPSGGNVAVSDIIALSAGVPADPVVFMAVDWYRRKCHAYPPE